MKNKFWKKIMALGLGFLCALVVMEIFLWAFGALCHKKQEAPLRRQTPVIACFGDSYTYGLGASSKNKSYPAQLNSILRDHASKYTVINHGVPGSNSAQLLEILPTVLKDTQPSAVIVLIGANNLWSLETSWQNTDTSFKTVLSKILFKLRIYRFYRYLQSQSPEEDKAEPITTINAEPPLSEADTIALKAAEMLNAERLSEAETLYRKAIMLDKNNGRHYAGLAEVYTHQIKPEYAFLTAIEGIKTATWGKAKVYASIGDYLALHNDRMSATHWLEKGVMAAIQDGESPNAIITPLLFSYFATGNQKRGIEFINSLKLSQKRRQELTQILSAQNLNDKLQAWLAHDIETIAELCRASGTKLFITTYPRQDDRFGVNDQLAALARRLKLPLIDNHNRFLRLEKQTPDFAKKYFAADGHCNDEGYAVMAVTAKDALSAQGFN